MGPERHVMQGYLDALFKRAGDYSDYFADDVVASMEGTGQRAEGRQAVAEFVRNLHRSAFDANGPGRKNVHASPAAATRSSPALCQSRSSEPPSPAA